MYAGDFDWGSAINNLREGPDSYREQWKSFLRFAKRLKRKARPESFSVVYYEGRSHRGTRPNGNASRQ